MDADRFIRPDEYQTLSFDLYLQYLYSYYWVDSSFSICYRFMSLLPHQVEQNTFILLKRTAIDPQPLFTEEGSIEYSIEKEEAFINFLNDKFKIVEIKVHYGNTYAMVMQLRSSAGQSFVFYAAATEPFGDIHKRIYGNV